MTTRTSRADRRRESKSRQTGWLWQGESPPARFALRFFAWLGALALLARTDIAAPLTRFVTTLVTHLSYELLTVSGSSARLVADTISSESAAVRVTSECSGVGLMAFVLAAVVAFPAPLRAKLTGGLAMVIVIVCVNTLRVASLYAISAYQPEFFDVAHHYIWQALLIIVAVGSWSYWAARVNELTRLTT